MNKKTKGVSKIKKYISIEDSDNYITKILSFTDINMSVNGEERIEVEYIDPPVLTSQLDISYPLYNKNTGTMSWLVVTYCNTATDTQIELENAKLTINNINAELTLVKSSLIELMLSM